MWFLLAALTSQPSLAADASKPHPHQGVVPKFKGRPTLPTLSPANLEALSAGKSVLIQSKGSGGGTGIAIQEVKASPKVIWSRILAFDHYHDWVDNVTSCKVYEKSGNTIKADFVIGAALFSAEYYVTHDVHTDQNYLTWELDYSRESDLDDSVGFWVVEELPDKPGYSRVYYSVNVRVGGWMPGFVENMIAKSGLTKATAWVKRESEKAS